MNGFEKRTQKIKERIKNVTLEMLMTMEPRMLRIADISKEANVSQVTIYKHFESKDNLIRETVQEWYINAIKRIEAYIADDTKTFHQKVSFIIFEEKHSLLQLNLKQLDTLIWQDEEMKKFEKNIYQERVLPLMLNLIEKGKREGAIHHDFSSSLIIFYLNIFMEKASSLADHAQATENKDAFIEDVAQLFFYGIAGKQ